MDSGWLVLLSVAFGLVVGGGFMALFHVAERRGNSAVDVVNPAVPDGVSQVIDALESAGVVLDPSNNVVKASPGALATGLVSQQVLVHSELIDLVNTVRSTGEPIVQPVQLARGPFGDASMHFLVRVARLGSRYILLLAEDHSETFRLDEVRRDFIANISHELKTPIGAIALLSEALDPAADDPEQVRRFAKRLHTEAARLTRITQEIIELSRLQAADTLLSAELLDVDHLIASAIDQNHVQAELRGTTLVKGGAKHVHVFGDEALLIMALHNLVGNAIQYSLDNSRVGIGVRVEDGVVEIAVTDQGLGIASEDLDRVFERFFRVDQARSRNTGGTGLGLSIVKHVVENHGGDVRVWSQLGRGSTFTIRLPEASTVAIAPQGDSR
ncbi:sensor histidine kinase [Agreia sp. Leaf210]|uniref:sensor histidine kinase n=1 Tax=Agreia sp. Leaf210 TaxID=1735682 RepID=UPI0006F2D289|nr:MULTISPECIES: ATP-binding protein [Microbacteriaceae]KQM59046.1 histidine kinase [Agreia sp. Leaf210]PPF61687.1 sensor histidine kinase [Clavibacter michiganensis]